ncbi:zinc-binding dehydrogenase [Micrococcoides hystricis]|uniref:Zinc-binding dehydrogenase n=1 Tax=Micrococcoides hystricis TaxID=1572761 RepID=A0ABV6PCA4_9MICC
MKALVYHGPNNKSWDEVADPVIQDPTDAIIRIDTTTICGTDLHILSGDVPAVQPGTILGHEGVGTVIAVGDAVTNFAEGDRVILSCITKCGKCDYCIAAMPSHCQSVGGIGWIFGHLINGTIAEQVRVPYADTSMVKLPEDVTDEAAIFLSDSLPTGYEMGVLYGGVKPGDSVVVVGAGAVGLGAIMTVGLWGASTVIAVDTNEFRLEKALEFGATHTINANDPDLLQKIKDLSEDGLGVDVSIEAVGYPETFDTALQAIRPGGTIANVGVHGKSIDFPLHELWISNIKMTTGLVDATSMKTLLKMVQSGKLPAEKMGTHTFDLQDIDHAWEVFANAGEHKALKVILKNKNA